MLETVGHAGAEWLDGRRAADGESAAVVGALREDLAPLDRDAEQFGEQRRIPTGLHPGGDSGADPRFRVGGWLEERKKRETNVGFGRCNFADQVGAPLAGIEMRIEVGGVTIEPPTQVAFRRMT